MLIQVGTHDDYEDGERPCDALLALFPPSARERETVRYIEGATHGFDVQSTVKPFYDPFARAGRGGTVNMVPSLKNADDARSAVVAFFVQYLKP